MESLHKYIDDIAEAFKNGSVLDGALRIAIPLVIINFIFWILSTIVSFAWKVLLPVTIVLLVIAYFSEA